MSVSQPLQQGLRHSYSSAVDDRSRRRRQTPSPRCNLVHESSKKTMRDRRHDQLHRAYTRVHVHHRRERPIIGPCSLARPHKTTSEPAPKRLANSRSKQPQNQELNQEFKSDHLPTSTPYPIDRKHRFGTPLCARPLKSATEKHSAKRMKLGSRSAHGRADHTLLSAHRHSPFGPPATICSGHPSTRTPLSFSGGI
jgi:hypothetical protein